MDKIIKLSTLICLLCFLLVGCKKESADIILLDCYVSDDDYGSLVNAPIEQFDSRIEEWKHDNPDVALKEKKRIGTSELAALGRLGADHLPDIFMAEGTLGRLLEAEGLVLDLSHYIDYSKDELNPFVYDEKIYAFPILKYSPSLVIYNGKALKMTGYDKFPDSLETLIEIDSKTHNMGYSYTLGISNTSVISGIISPCLAMTSPSWLSHMVKGDKTCSFTDSSFIDILDFVQKFYQSNVICQDYMGKTADSLIDDYVHEKCLAVMLSGEDIYRLLEKTRETHKDLYINTDFCGLNLFNDAETKIPLGLSYGLFINANVAKNPDKLEKCINLCQYLSSFEYQPIPSDDVLNRLDTILKTASVCPMVNQYLRGNIWSIGHLLDNKDPEGADIVASEMQNTYEQYYLNIEDYSKKADQYL